MEPLRAHMLARLLLAGPDLPVKVEGCDCYQDAGGVVVEIWETDPSYVLIEHTKENNDAPTDH